LTLTSLYIAAVTSTLIIAKNVGLDMIESLLAASTLSLIFTATGSVINVRLMKKLTALKLTYSPLLKYAYSSCITAAIVYLLRALLKPPSNIFGAVGNVVLLTAVGGVIYGCTSYLISDEFRNHLREAFSYIKSL
jgi:hypothetical protein